MNYIDFFKWGSHGEFESSIPSDIYKMYNEWLEGDIQGDKEIVNEIIDSVTKIKNGILKEDEFWGNDMVLFIDKDGVKVQCNLAYDGDPNIPSDEFPMSVKLTLENFSEMMFQLKKFLESQNNKPEY